jgi:hypothetical protein
MPALSSSANRFLRSYVVPALVLIGILVAWDFTKPRIPKNLPEPPRQVEDRPNGGVPPWNAHEDLLQHGRDLARNAALRGLDQAWSTFCDPESREKNLRAISYYFEQRRNQEKSYVERWGKEGRNYITGQWSTPDDARIERLVEELYGRGYLKLGNLKPYIAERIAPLVKDTHVTGEPCKN